MGASLLRSVRVILMLCIAGSVVVGCSLDEQQCPDCAAGAEACLRGGRTPSQYVDNGSRIEPVGYEGGGHMHKSHLIGRRFGGANDMRENMVALFQRSNTSGMKVFEKEVAGRVNAGESVYYLVRPVYSACSDNPLVPIGVQMYCASSSGSSNERFIPNPS